MIRTELACLPLRVTEPFASHEDLLEHLSAILEEPEPAEERLSTLPPPPTTRTRATVRPGAKEKSR